MSAVPIQPGDDEQAVTEAVEQVLKEALCVALLPAPEGADGWVTPSALPHQLRVHKAQGMWMLRVSAGCAVVKRPTKSLLEHLSAINKARSLTRVFWSEGIVMVSCDVPVPGLTPQVALHAVDSVLCTARLDALDLEELGATPLAPLGLPLPEHDLEIDDELALWRATGTATERELAQWIDQHAGVDSVVEMGEDIVDIWFRGLGTVGHEFPFPLGDLLTCLPEEDDDDD